MWQAGSGSPPQTVRRLGHERKRGCRSWAPLRSRRNVSRCGFFASNDGYLIHDPKRSSTRGTGSRAERYRVTGVSSIPGTGCALGLRTAKHRAAGSKVLGHLGFFSRSFHLTYSPSAPDLGCFGRRHDAIDAYANLRADEHCVLLPLGSTPGEASGPGRRSSARDRQERPSEASEMTRRRSR